MTMIHENASWCCFESLGLVKLQNQQFHNQDQILYSLYQKASAN